MLYCHCWHICILNEVRCYSLMLDSRYYSNVADGITTVVHNVLHEYFVLSWVAGETLMVLIIYYLG